MLRRTRIRRATERKRASLTSHLFAMSRHLVCPNQIHAINAQLIPSIFCASDTWRPHRDFQPDVWTGRCRLTGYIFLIVIIFVLVYCFWRPWRGCLLVRFENQTNMLGNASALDTKLISLQTWRISLYSNVIQLFSYRCEIPLSLKFISTSIHSGV
jgi:hypothetical protein